MPGQQITKHAHDLVLAGAEPTGQHGAPVGRRIRLPRRETAIALARYARSGRIDPLQIAEHGFNRAGQAVDIEAVEPYLRFRVVDPLVVITEPLDKIVDLLVPPHPDRKTGERSLRSAGEGRVPHVMVDTGRVRPIGLYGHDGESEPFHELARDAGPHPVELAGSVGRLAK
jgi:hypothetical protein